MIGRFLPYGRQTIDDSDVAAVENVLRGDFLTTGPAVEKFERSLAAATGATSVTACANGTAALHLASRALGLARGDSVIVPAITFLATANAPVLEGAEVVFADVDPETGLMRPGDLAEAFVRARTSGKNVKAVFPVHLAGQCEDLEAIFELSSEHGASVVEDACHALGTRWRGEPAGNCKFSTMATFSFHPLKTIASGEGGAVTTKDEELHARLMKLRNHGMTRGAEAFEDHEAGFEDGDPNPWYYEMPEPGFNYRLSDIHAALGSSQLKRLGEFVERRRALVDAYGACMKGLPNYVRPLGRTPDCEPAWHLYVVLIDFAAAGTSRGKVMRALRERGIGTQVHYIPLPNQPYYRVRETNGNYPGAASYYERCLSLPLFPAMTEDDVADVCSTLAEVLAQ